MRRYRVQTTRKAEKDLRSLPYSYALKFELKFSALSQVDNPKSFLNKLQGHEDLYYIRAGDYRAILGVQDDLLIIMVIQVDKRSKSYRKY